MQRILPWSCSWLTPLACASSGVSSGSCSVWPITIIYIWDSNIIAMHVVQRVIRCIIMHNLSMLTLTSYFKFTPIIFSIIAI
jgi:hypothetical protein